jgi:tryptophan-rich sensory protein
MNLQFKSHIQAYAVACIAALAVAMLGGLMTDIGPWYRSLAKPPWQPPDIAFGPAWTLIFACTAVAAVKAWHAIAAPKQRDTLLVLLSLNGFLNVLWSLLFFRLRRPDWALIEVVLLWLSILALIVFVWRYSRTAAYLLMPYLAWVTFAAALNAAVVRLNAPFGVAAG